MPKRKAHPEDLPARARAYFSSAGGYGYDVEDYQFNPVAPVDQTEFMQEQQDHSLENTFIAEDTGIEVIEGGPSEPQLQDRQTNTRSTGHRDSLLFTISNSPLLFVTEDRREGHFLVHDTRQDKKGVEGFAFVGLRIVTFSDNNWKVVGWCSSRCCGGAGHPGKCCEGLDAADEQIDFDTFFSDDSESMCEYSRLLYSGLGGNIDSLLALFGVWSIEEHYECGYLSADLTCLVKSFELFGKQYTIVRIDSEFKNWGIVEHKTDRATGTVGGYCRTCKTRQKKNCVHTAELDFSLYNVHANPRSHCMQQERYKVMLQRYMDLNTGQYKVYCLSRKTPPVFLENDNKLRELADLYEHGLPELCGPSDNEICQGCGRCEWSDVIGNGYNTLVVFPRKSQYVEFGYRTCLSCEHRLECDGQEYAVHRQSKGKAYNYLVMYDYLQHLLLNGSKPAYEYWRELVNCHRASSAIEKGKLFVGGYKDFQQALFDFRELQNLDYASIFCCPHNEESLQADGITIGTQYRNTCIFQSVLPSDSDPIKGGILFTNRVFLCNQQVRQDVQKLANTGLDDVGYRQLLKRLSNCQEDIAKPLKDFIESYASQVATNKGKMLWQLPVNQKLLVFDIGSEQPPTVVLKPHIFQLVQDAISGSKLSSSMLADVERYSPILYGVFKKDFTHGNLQDVHKALLEKMLSVAKGVYECKVDIPQSEKSQKAIEWLQRTKLSTDFIIPPALWNSRDMAFLMTATWGGSGLRQAWQPSELGGTDNVRKLENYAADRFSFGQASSCNKDKPFRRTLVPGTNLFWCTKCSKCKGMQVMLDAEQPRTCFNWLVTRCLTAPKEFMRDDGCHDHHFGMNREPLYLRNTEFLIDQPHKRGHRGCANSYDTKFYGGRFANTPLAEQKNSALKLLRQQVPYMSLPNFLRHLRYILALFNLKVDMKASGKLFFAL